MLKNEYRRGLDGIRAREEFKARAMEALRAEAAGQAPDRTKDRTWEFTPMPHEGAAGEKPRPRRALTVSRWLAAAACVMLVGGVSLAYATGMLGGYGGSAPDALYSGGAAASQNAAWDGQDLEDEAGMPAEAAPAPGAGGMDMADDTATNKNIGDNEDDRLFSMAVAMAPDLALLDLDKQLAAVPAALPVYSLPTLTGGEMALALEETARLLQLPAPELLDAGSGFTASFQTGGFHLGTAYISDKGQVTVDLQKEWNPAGTAPSAQAGQQDRDRYARGLADALGLEGWQAATVLLPDWSGHIDLACVFTGGSLPLGGALPEGSEAAEVAESLSRMVVRMGQDMDTVTFWAARPELVMAAESQDTDSAALDGLFPEDIPPEDEPLEGEPGVVVALEYRLDMTGERLAPFYGVAVPLGEEEGLQSLDTEAAPHGLAACRITWVAATINAD